MPNAHVPVTHLDTNFKTLRQRWEESKTLWNDPVRWDFEKRHWQPLEQETLTTLREMARLAEVLTKAIRHAEML